MQSLAWRKNPNRPEGLPARIWGPVCRINFDLPLHWSTPPHPNLYLPLSVGVHSLYSYYFPSFNWGVTLSITVLTLYTSTVTCSRFVWQRSKGKLRKIGETLTWAGFSSLDAVNKPCPPSHPWHPLFTLFRWFIRRKCIWWRRQARAAPHKMSVSVKAAICASHLAFSHSKPQNCCLQPNLDQKHRHDHHCHRQDATIMYQSKKCCTPLEQS